MKWKNATFKEMHSVSASFSGCSHQRSPRYILPLPVLLQQPSPCPVSGYPQIFSELFLFLLLLSNLILIFCPIYPLFLTSLTLARNCSTLTAPQMSLLILSNLVTPGENLSIYISACRLFDSATKHQHRSYSCSTLIQLLQKKKQKFTAFSNVYARLLSSESGISR